MAIRVRNPVDITAAMEALPEALLGLVQQVFANDLPGRPDPLLLQNALETATDEDRLHYAEAYGEEVLSLADLPDAAYFRKCVWRKENAAFIRYHKQRDHSIHTLHNYLLGWYFFAKSERFRNHLEAAMVTRKTTTENAGELARRFAEVWCYASLLHDVGYLFEGITSPNDKHELLDEMVRNGRDNCFEYFNDVFWTDLGFPDADTRPVAQTLVNNRVGPGEGSGGPASIAYFLRDLGPWQVMAHDLKHGSKVAKHTPDALSADAFEVWRLHYDHYKQPHMVERIRVLEKTLYDILKNGVPDQNVPPHLDHGICGGLMLLKYSTWWFRAFITAKWAKKKPNFIQRPLTETENRVVRTISSGTKFAYHAAHWWSSILWATAAVALHNIQQHPEYLTNAGMSHAKLKISEDPLAYLGILVDILQEWDRHSVHKLAKINSDRRCINSRDVRIGLNTDGLICIEYTCRDCHATKRQNRMVEDLNNALADWDKLVTFQFISKNS